MKSKRTRRVLVLGALIGSVLSVGVATGTASANKGNTKNSQTVTVVDDVYDGATSMLSGIRW